MISIAQIQFWHGAKEKKFREKNIKFSYSLLIHARETRRPCKCWHKCSEGWLYCWGFPCGLGKDAKSTFAHRQAWRTLCSHCPFSFSSPCPGRVAELEVFHVLFWSCPFSASAHCVLYLYAIFSPSEQRQLLSEMCQFLPPSYTKICFLFLTGALLTEGTEPWHLIISSQYLPNCPVQTGIEFTVF